jgi:hypothetical protein
VKRKLKFVAVVVAVLLLAAYTSIYLIVGTESFRRRAERELSARSGYTITIETLHPTPWLGLVVSGVAVSHEGVALFEGRRVSASFLPHDLYFRRIRTLSLERPVLHVSLQDLFRPRAKPSSGFSIGALTIENGELALDTGHGTIRFNEISADATNVSLAGQGGLRLRADVPALEGSAVVSISGGPAERRAEIAIQQNKKSAARSAGDPKQVFTGAVRLAGKAGDAYEATATGAMRDLRFGAATMSGDLSARLDAGAKFETARIAIDLKTPEFPAALLPATMPVAPGPARASLEGEYSAAGKSLTLKKVDVLSALGAITGAGTVSFAERPARLAAMLTLSDAPLDGLKALLHGALAALRYNGKLAAKVSLSGPYNAPHMAGTVWSRDGSARGENLSVGNFSFNFPFGWNGSLETKKGEFLATDVSFGGKGETHFKVARMRLATDLSKPLQEPLAVNAAFDVAGGGFSTPDQTKIGENWSAKGRLRCRDCGGDAGFQVEAQTQSLELLWNKFFGDFKARKPAVRIEGRYRKAAGAVDLHRMSVALEAIGRVDLAGSIEQLFAKPSFALEIKSDDFRPGGVYDFFVRDAFKAAYPALAEIAASGKSALALKARGTREAFTVEGKLRLEQALVQERSGRWRAGPIDLDLPLKVGYPAAPNDTGAAAAAAGRFSIGEIKSASVAIPQISAPAILWNNALRFPEPISASLFGGRATVTGLAWKDIVAAPADLSFSLELKDLKLDEVTNALGWHRFGGTLSGSIPRVRSAGGALIGDGTMTLSLFGGRAELRGLEIEKPFSALRAVRLNARLDGLDLEQASNTFEFGHISGAISGTIDGLVLAQGQPEEFRAEIYTVDKPGVSRWISVDALNKITVVSSGNDAGSLYGGLASLFDFYRYRKLGFKASLKNDTLTLRGIESRDGREYLVVGTLLPPTVNIVSHTQEIGFSELMARLERVKNSGRNNRARSGGNS